MLALACLLSYSLASATVPAIDMNELRSGELLFYHDDLQLYQPATQLSTEVTMSISGMVARVTLAQRFKNEGEAFAEAIYAFPLPEDSAVDTLRMRINDRVIEGEIQEREEARATYEAARAAGQQTSLVEQERPNLFTTSLANIPPNAEIVVEISYLESLDYQAKAQGGEFSMRFPLAITPRYTPMPMTAPSGKIEEPSVVVATEEEIEVSDTGWATAADTTTANLPPVAPLPPAAQLYSTAEPHSVSIAIELDAGFPLAALESRYHAITEEQQGTRYYISLAEENVPADRDFELRWSPQVGSEPAAAIFHENWRAEPYALVMLMPPSQARDTSALPVQAREMIFILDTSGSMNGISINQAKAALDLALSRLKPHDKFNIIEFNSYATQLYRTSQVAHAENIGQARAWLSELYADGGTEMLSALNLAFADEPSPNYLRQIIFITDGSVSNETQLFQSIDQRLGANRLFTVGIGAAPNSYFMRKAAEFGRGSYTFIADIAEVQEKMAELFTKLENPVLTGLEVNLPEGSEAFPSTVPDMYAGEPVVMQVKLPDTNGTISLTGSDYGRAWTRNLNLQSGAQQSGISQLWARAKIEELTAQRDRGGEFERLKSEITALALHHHLLSEYTSLVAVDPTVVREDGTPLNSEIIPQTLPHGQVPPPAPAMMSRAVMPQTSAIPSGGYAGPVGAAGPVGPIGATGTLGASGPAGPVGPVAPVGPVGPVGPVAPVGPTGAAGLPCWDTNGNGIADAEEDLNGDGVVDMQDCIVDDTSVVEPAVASCTGDLVTMMSGAVDELMLELNHARSHQVHYTFIARDGTDDIMATIRASLEQYNWVFARALPRASRDSNQIQERYECAEDGSNLTVTIEPIGRSFLYDLWLERSSN